jgi:hypothetical protein
MGRKRAQRGPWRIVWGKVDEMGRGSQPRLRDAAGKPVRMGELGNAKLVVRAPEMRQLLDQIDKDLYLMVALIRAEYPSWEPPAWVETVSNLHRWFW